MSIQLTLDDLKALAHKSKNELLREGLDLGHKQCLDLQSRIHGFRNYEEAKAKLEPAKTVTGSATLGAELRITPPPPLPELVQRFASDPVARVKSVYHPSPSKQRDELARARQEGRSDQALAYLAGTRFGCTDRLAFLMLGWVVPDKEYPMEADSPGTSEQLKACREIMLWPESVGRVAEIARLGRPWAEIAANWEALCAVHDHELHERFPTLVTAGSLSALACQGQARASKERVDQIGEAYLSATSRLYPRTDWRGWRMSEICSGGHARTYGSVDSDEDDPAENLVWLPEECMTVTLVKFGHPPTLVMIPRSLLARDMLAIAKRMDSRLTA